MPDFTTPNLDTGVGRPAGHFLSVRRDDREVYIARGLIKRFDLTAGDRLVLAFDEDRRPWVGFVSSPDTDNDAPGARIAVYHHGGGPDARTTSSRVAMHLKKYAPEDGRGRLYLNGDTETTGVEGHTVRLHRLTPEHDPSDE